MNNKLKYGELSWKILKALSRTSLGLENLVDRILIPGFGYKGQLTKGQWLRLQQRRRERKKQYVADEFWLKEKLKVAVLINRFQKMGLVKNAGSDKGRADWTITNNGLIKLLKLEEKLLSLINKEKLPPINYPTIKSKHKIIVVFDIAEKEKHKREWLRQVLKNLEFKILQKSVWIGTTQLPIDLITDLERLEIAESVKIFSIFEEGNITTPDI